LNTLVLTGTWGHAVRLGMALIFTACNVPVATDTLAADNCERSHRLGDLDITLSCAWQLETQGTNMYWLRNGRNTILLQNGKIAGSLMEHYDADSSLQATFRERRVPGEVTTNRNVKFIHGVKPLSGGRGDSVYVYMEDTTKWMYYHFDCHFVNAGLRDDFLDAMRGSELIR
jgi:hypothetical protein